MDHIVQQNEKMQGRRKRKRMRDFELGVDILLLVLSILTQLQYFVSLLQRHIRKPTIRLGHEDIQNVLVEDRNHF